MKFIQNKGIRLAPLLRKRITVLGYGSQGRAQALNLRDSGCQVVVGLRRQSLSFRVAKRDKILAQPIAEALVGADLICFLMPDEVQQGVYETYVNPILRKGMGLVFAHGLNITFKKIVPRKNVDVFMVAPKGPGPKLRQAYLDDEHLPSLVAVYQNATGQAKKLCLAFAKGIGCAKRGMFLTNFREETISDLFGEQAVLCGGVVALIKAAFETLVEAGISPEAAYFECFHELKFIVDLLHLDGLSGMAKAISPTAHYGGLTRGKQLINADVRRNLKKILREITSGRFADEWLLESKRGKKRYKKLSQQSLAQPLEVWGKKVRKKIGY